MMSKVEMLVDVLSDVVLDTVEDITNTLASVVKSLWDEKVIMTNLSEKLTKRCSKLHQVKSQVEDLIKYNYRRVAMVFL